MFLRNCYTSLIFRIYNNRIALASLVKTKLEVKCTEDSIFTESPANILAN